MQSSLRIIVTGLITQHPRLGGITWHYLQYVLGLARLGHDVYYFEDSGEFPYNLDGGTSGHDWIARDCTYNVNYLAKLMSRFGLENRWAYHFPLKSMWFGLTGSARAKIVESADLLINVSGSLERPQDYRRIPHLLYIDTDPIVTQLKITLGDLSFLERVDVHDTQFSFGESLSKNPLATGHDWRPTRQPIVLSEWRPDIPHGANFTTVMNWTSYEPLVYADQTYGQKDIEFKRFLGLPSQLTATAMEMALSRIQYLKWQTKDETLPPELGELLSDKTDWTPRDLITYAGWRVVDAIEVGGDFDSYRHYIESSKAEWSVAKNAYVLGQPGWFSERSACYLAAGRPVVVQDTGFADVLPVGEGLLSFRTLPEAVAAIQEVETNYTLHAQAARALAETHFDAEQVLTCLIDQALSINKPMSQGAREEIRESASPQVPSKSSRHITLSGLSSLHHPSVKAWAKLGPERVRPDRIEVLKEGTKGAVYRLAGVGAGNAAIIAKRCRHARCVIERAVYEQALSSPELSSPELSSPQYYGCTAEEDGQNRWIFLEDVGDVRYSPLVEEQRMLAARWLGMLHIGAERLPVKAALPARGTDHYRAYLRSVLQTLPQIQIMPSLKATEQTILQNIVAMCEYLEAHWSQLEAFCAPLPRTLIHGDCLAKNVHVRTTQAGVTILPFDWGGAGWGFPATDLGLLGLPYKSVLPSEPDCVTYWSVVQDHWPNLDLQTIQQLSNLGQLFWALKVISRGVPEFDHPKSHIETLINNFRVYKSVLANTMRLARWEE